VNINAKGMVNNNNFTDQSAIGGAIGYDPTKPVYNGNTRWRGYTTWTGGGINGTPNVLAAGNPVAKIDLTDNTSTVMRSIGNIKFDYELPLIKNLHASLNLGYDYTDTKGHNNVLDSTQWITIPGGGQRNKYSSSAKNQLLDFYLTYSPELKSINSKVEVMGGYSWSHFYRYRYSITTNYYGNEDTKSGGIPNPSEYYLISLFGRLNYTFKDKYLFTATLRSDATSRFSRDLRNGIFPSVALGWKIKQEEFLKDSKVISDLKLRAGYGKTGQQDTGIDADYPYLATYTLSDDASRYQLGNSLINTYRPDAFNNKIKWETTETFNLGLDFGFVENKITGSLDFYQRKSIDLIVKARTAKGTNFGSEVYSNIGNVTNKGVELNLNAEVVSNENLQWVIGYNVAYNTNRVTKVTASNDPDYFISTGGLGCSTCGFIQAQKIGNPRNAFIVYQQVYDSEGKPVQDVYVDRNKDGIINESDRYIYKKPDPAVLMGINSRMNYKNWDFSFSGRVSLGNYVYNGVAAGSTYSSLYGVNALSNTSTQALKTNFKDASLERFSDFYIENASFFRMDNINLGYTFENMFKTDWKLRVGAGVQNVFVITKYSGIDPEIAGGLDNNFFPRTRSYFINFNWQF
jgi:iron complex outermembrane receptor protein